MAIYMKLDPGMGDVAGESTETGHVGWIELTSMQWGSMRNIITHVGAGSTRELSQPSCQDVNVTKRTDKASVALFKGALAGKAGLCEIHMTQTIGAAPRTYLELKLENTLISSYSISGSEGWMDESLSLNFTKIEYRYIPHDDAGVAAGPKTGFFDLQLGTTG